MLASFVCASLTEEHYRVVQRDVPHILEAFLSFLTALEEYQVEVTTLYVPPTPDEITQGNFKVLREKERTRVEVAKATETIGIIADGTFFEASHPSRMADVLVFFWYSALRSGVADITQTVESSLLSHL